MSTTDVIAIIAVIISIGGWFGIPYFAGKFSKNEEEQKKRLSFFNHLNSLKEKWLEYVREQFENYLYECFLLSTLQTESRNTYKHDSNRGQILSDYSARIAECKAKIEAKETRIRLLFKKDSEEFNKIEPILKVLSNSADESNNAKIREAQNDLTNILQPLLRNEWKTIKNQYDIDTIFKY